MSTEIIQIIKTLFGTTKLGVKTVAVFVGFAFITAWLPDGVAELFKQEGDINIALLQIFAPILFLIFVWFKLRKIADNTELLVSVDKNPPKAKGLILFLSNNKNAEECEGVSNIKDMQSNWKQPLVAIDFHKERLEYLHILASAESFCQKEQFERLLNKLISETKKVSVEFFEPIDFEDAKAIFDTLKKSFEELKQSGCKKSDICIDLTGGTKVVALAGSIFALPEDRAIEYVTNKGEVKVYDLIYKQAIQ
ncbi:MAG: hypothetical protein GXX07_00925 [Wolinella succinogenes]|uniref:hypothetical protein n=1 Tax=Wolinella succinogenes TaxID=844 RepID=UPI0016B5B6CE|nr:hypothetical protein [Wolinella succinogenes]NLU33506.1 hypothetical protein [Wolinella succinogenes]